MYYYSIFHQLFKFVPRYRFEKSVEKHSGDRYCKHFTAIRQLKTVLYAQLAGKDSLREVESGLLMNAGRMYHLDMEAVSRSTLSDAMNRRSPEIFRTMFENKKCRLSWLHPIRAFMPRFFKATFPGLFMRPNHPHKRRGKPFSVFRRPFFDSGRL